MKALDVERLVFLDEMSIDTAMHERFAWAPLGDTPTIESPRYGKRVTVVGAIAVNGIVACSLFEGSLNGALFVDWIREELGPWLPPNALLVMDNLSVHGVEGVDEALDDFGATALYLPAYSPELNPIELCWAWIKRHLRKHAKRHIDALIELFGNVWNRLSKVMCTVWVRHCGYAVDST